MRHVNPFPAFTRLPSFAAVVVAQIVAAPLPAQFPDFTETRPAGPRRILAPLPAERPTPPDVRFGNFRPLNAIDQFILARLKAEKIRPKPLCDDWTFARRASLDLVGIIPTVQDLERYQRWDARDRREKWVDLLLRQRHYADRWTIVLGDLLRERGRVPGAPPNALRDFLHASLLESKPYDQLVRELVSAEGAADSNPATAFILQDRFDRDVLTVAVTDAFMGVSLKCAQCHNHPFDYWTQDEFRGMAGYFRGIRREVVSRDPDGRRRDTVLGVLNVPRRAAGRFITGAVSEHGYGPAALAELLTSPDNPYFARVAVNRLWEQMMGVGLVNPSSNFSPLNPPSHPELLDWLAMEFIDSGYDLRHILRLIATSRTYQATSSDSLASWASVERHNRRSPDDDIVPGALFEGMRLRRMSAEQLNDSILVATGHYPDGIAGNRPSARVTYPPRPGSFLRAFGASDREAIPTGQREPSVQQALTLLNGDFLNHAIRYHPSHPITVWRRERGLSLSQIIEATFYQILTRPPTKRERAWAAELVGSGGADDAWEDLQWALFNTREFQFIR